MILESFDIATAPDADLAALERLRTAIDREAVPHDEPRPMAEIVSQARNVPSNERWWSWVAWDDDRTRILGESGLAVEQFDTNTHLGWGALAVAADHRRRGLATALMQPVLDQMRAEGRSSLLMPTHGRIPAGARFMEGLGAERRFVGHHNVVDLGDVDRAMLEGWVERAKERAAGYHLECWDDVVPDEWVERFAGAWNVINTAPRDDLDMDDYVYTVDIVRDFEQKAAARGISLWNVASVHSSTGAIAGYTTLALPSHWPARAYQEGTAVDPAHRNRGLGRWIKAVNLLRLMDERPLVRRINTGNAGSNAPMLGINHAIGFRCYDEQPFYQGDVEVLAKAVAARR